MSSNFKIVLDTRVGPLCTGIYDKLSITLLYSASSVLKLAAPAAQFLLCHSVLSSVTLTILRFLPRMLLSPHSENACLNEVTPIVSACLPKYF